MFCHLFHSLPLPRRFRSFVVETHPIKQTNETDFDYFISFLVEIIEFETL